MKMKLSFFFLMIGFVFAGSSQSLLYIDSIKVSPPNPTATDSVFLEAWVTTAYQGYFNSDTVIQNGSDFDVRVCYDIGMLTVITSVYSKTFVTINQPGIYNVIYTPYVTGSGSGNTSCAPEGTPSDTITVSITTGIGKPGRNEVNVFPNPASDKFSVLNVKPGDRFNVYNATGTLIMSECALNADYSADVSALPPGIYLLQRISGSEISGVMLTISR